MITANNLLDYGSWLQAGLVHLVQSMRNYEQLTINHGTNTTDILIRVSADNSRYFSWSPCHRVIVRGTCPLCLPLGHTSDNYTAAQHTLPRPQQSATSRVTSDIKKQIFIRLILTVSWCILLSAYPVPFLCDCKTQ